MSEVNILAFSQMLGSTFQRYLFTSNAISDDEPELRRAFWDGLQARESFARPPLLSTIPTYATVESIADLIGRTSVPHLHSEMMKVASDELDIERSLYTHQVDGLRCIENGQNLVVATGTGSGKTECFLLPILNDILTRSRSGVRAILIYPMNALANDQLDRLRRLLRDLPQVTFGRYTGDTPEDMSEVEDRDASEILKPNERYTRQEIRAEPPHILLTNFAMLEYLLLRPRDADIFKQQTLRFVVLDEAHTYNGAQGIEVGLLMRRLREAYPSTSNSLQFVLTSATLADPDLSRARTMIAGFASNLTGGEFSADNIILGDRLNPFGLGQTKRIALENLIVEVPSNDVLLAWLNDLGNLDSLKARLTNKPKLNVPTESLQANNVGEVLYKWLKNNAEIAQLHEICSEKPSTLDELSNALWGCEDDDAIRVTQLMVILGAHATRDASSSPLLPARYHFFFRGLGGGSICLAPSCSERGTHRDTFWSKLVLEDRVECPNCGCKMLPIKSCVHCGMLAVVVREKTQGFWQGARATDTEGVHILTWDKSFADEEEAELEEESTAEEIRNPRWDELCLSCQRIGIGQGSLGTCCTRPQIVRLRLLDSAGDGQLKRCPRCGGAARPFPSVLREFSTGEDAPTAVLAEAVIRALPAEFPTKPASGRQLLAFSDSRQRAAHFAPYLARTTGETQFLKPLLDSIAKADADAGGQGASFNEIAQRFTRDAQRQPYLILRRTTEEAEAPTRVVRAGEMLASDKRQITRECLISLFQHFTSSPRSRNNIPGLGLASVAVDFSEEEKDALRAKLPNLFGGSANEGFGLIQHLLSIFQHRKAITFPEDITLRQIEEGPQMATYHICLQGDIQGRRRYRWNPYLAPQRSKANAVRRSYQAAMVSRFLGCDREREGDTISQILNQIWEALRDVGIIDQVTAGEFQLNYERLTVTTKRPWVICTRCGRLTAHALRNCCGSPDCEGHTEPRSYEELRRRFENHHWYHRLTEMEPLPLEVREHTAQLNNMAGREYQRRFRDKLVNVLSSSTTFEMGVDVGQLKAVFLRNVPPTAANYIQRAGRAGRRREGAAYAITFARATPHDQFHYHEPLAIVRGSVPVPQISLANPRLTQRHVNAFLLGGYLRSGALGSENPRTTVSDLFLTPSVAESPSSKFSTWIEKRTSYLRPILERVIPREAQLDCDIAMKNSGNSLFGEDGISNRIARKLAAFDSQREELNRALQSVSNANERILLAQAMKSVEALKSQLCSETLIDFLSSEHWLPSYAFPQDVVRLLVRQPKWTGKMRLERDGEFGISEYAPGAEIIADGHVFRSGGVDRQHRELEVRKYRVCSNCRRVEQCPASAQFPSACACGSIPQGLFKLRNFIEPPGFTTLWDDEVPEPRLFRLRPPPTSEVFLVEGAAPEAFIRHAEMRGITLGYRSDGLLFRANPGRAYRQFRICQQCGRGFDPKENTSNHRTPWGSRCSGGLIARVDLAFQFRTDTLQIRFDSVNPEAPAITDRSFWSSLQMAFVGSAAEVLGIPTGDIDGTFRSQFEHGRGGELVVFDRVPGGAGYVERIRHELVAILRAAYSRTRNCRNQTCDSRGSCYACLRTYGNQFQWDQLNRGLVADWLEGILSNNFVPRTPAA
jgi:hypothetical protein